ncbi:hypothetical protein [Sulfitobacter sp.]|uniref:hypothetical protein n=1 Tax=Sulfitobacter sp. TaxID=1903071 RepID=UPI003002AF94
MRRSFFWEVGIAFSILVIGVAANFDVRPTYKDLEATVLQEPFSDGRRALLYRWDGVVLRNCTGALRREVRQGGETFYLPDRTFTWIPSGRWSGEVRQNFVVAVGLGDFEGRLSNGLATYHVTQVSHCNRIQAWFGYAIEEAYPPVSFLISNQS